MVSLFIFLWNKSHLKCFKSSFDIASHWFPNIYLWRLAYIKLSRATLEKIIHNFQFLKVRFRIIFLAYHAYAQSIKFKITEIVSIPKNKSYLSVSFCKISIYFIFIADLKSYLYFQLPIKFVPIKHFCIHLTMNARTILNFFFYKIWSE